MTARKGKDPRRLIPRKIAWAAALLLTLCLASILAFGFHRQALARWRRERDREEMARRQASNDANLALQRQIADLRAAWGRASVPHQPHSELLLALAQATPANISLRELRCDGDGFLIRGHVYEKADRPDSPLIQFCRDLTPPETPWRFSGGPEVVEGDFAWRGTFQATAGSQERDERSKVFPIPADAGIVAAGQWGERVSGARARLPAEKDFKVEAEPWNRKWTVLIQSVDRLPDLEIRHWALAYPHPTLGSWSEVVQTVRGLCAEPGVTIDSLVLAAAPDGSDAFTQAQLTVTARLRR
jgi:hypothetical protein